MSKGAYAGSCGAYYDARKALGKTARVGIDFTVRRGADGLYRWVKNDVNPPTEDASLILRFSRREFLLYTALYEKPRTSMELNDLLFGDREDGGPLSSVLLTLLWQLNALLNLLVKRQRIIKAGSGPYHLVGIAPCPAETSTERRSPKPLMRSLTTDPDTSAAITARSVRASSQRTRQTTA